MLAAIRSGVRHALVRAEVPVEMAVFLCTALVCGEEAAAAGAALVWLGVVEGVDEFRAESFEGGGGHGDAGAAGVGQLIRCAGLGRGREETEEGFEEGFCGLRWWSGVCWQCDWRCGFCGGEIG